MAGSLIKLTNAGSAALVGPGNVGTATRTISKIGVATAAFVPTEDLLVLPNERKQLDTFGGDNVAPDTVHVTLRDDTADQYTLYGLGLYLDNGVLFGTYSQETPILEKSPAAMLLLSTDLRFTTIDAALLQFGNSEWTNPPATEARAGVAEIATQPEADAGLDDTRIITPKKLAARVSALVNGAPPSLDTLGELAAAIGNDPTYAATVAALLAQRAALAGATFTGPITLSHIYPSLTFAESDQAGAPGKWRFVADGKNLYLRRNTAAAGDFSAEDYVFLVNESGAIGYTHSPSVPTPAPGDNSGKAANTAFVAAAIAALVNSSPAALDTLNELATALGNDPNFATTITNALALKAALASPEFSGIPRAPTPALGTNTTQIATAAALMAGLYSGKGVQPYFTPGTYSFTVPAGVTKLWVTICAGGGGGAAYYDASSGGGGGGAGASGFRVPVAVTPGQVLTIAVGAAGNGGGVVGANGTAGGVSSVGALLSATGGGGGTSAGSGGTSGTGSGLQPGGAGQAYNPAAVTSEQGGQGGGSIFGVGGFGAIRSGAESAKPGAGFGSGGGGGCRNAGAQGAGGLVILEW